MVCHAHPTVAGETIPVRVCHSERSAAQSRNLASNVTYRPFAAGFLRAVSSLGRNDKARPGRREVLRDHPYHLQSSTQSAELWSGCTCTPTAPGVFPVWCGRHTLPAACGLLLSYGAYGQGVCCVAGDWAPKHNLSHSRALTQPTVHSRRRFSSTIDRPDHQRGAADRISGRKHPRLTGLAIGHYYIAFSVKLQA